MGKSSPTHDPLGEWVPTAMPVAASRRCNPSETPAELRAITIVIATNIITTILETISIYGYECY